jgi:6-phosphogluconolactonase
MKQEALRWHVYENKAQAVTAVTGMIELDAAGAIAVRGRFAIVLAGGETPQPVYARLARYANDWSRWHVYFGDERCLPRGDAERNDTRAREAWLDQVPIPRGQIHTIPAELGADAAAAAYYRLLTAEPPFDLALLGLGEDGHSASLFPGRNHRGAPATPDVVAVHDAPKPPAERVSLSLPRLSRSERIAVLAFGSSKRAALQKLRDGEDLPVNQLRPLAGIDIFVDRAAAGL